MTFHWSNRMAVLIHIRKRVRQWAESTGMGVVLYFIVHSTASQLPCTFLPIASYLIQPFCVYLLPHPTLPQPCIYCWLTKFIHPVLFLLIQFLSCPPPPPPFFFSSPFFICPLHSPFLSDCACFDKQPVLGRVVYLFSFWLVCLREPQPS